MSGIPFIEGPLAGAAVANVLADRVAEYGADEDEAPIVTNDIDNDDSNNITDENAPSAAAAAAAAASAMAGTPLSDDNSIPPSTSGRKLPAIEVVAIHRDSPVLSPASFAAHYEAAALRHSGVSTPLPDIIVEDAAGMADNNRGAVNAPVTVVVEEVTELQMETVEYDVPDAVVVVEDVDVELDSDDHGTEDQVDAVEPIAAAAAAGVSVEEVPVESGDARAEAEAVREAPAQETEEELTREPQAPPPPREGATTHKLRRSRVSVADKGDDGYDEIPIHESADAQFVLLRPRRSSASPSTGSAANSPHRASASTAAGAGSGSRHESVSSVRPARLARGDRPEVMAHPFVLVRRSSSSGDGGVARSSSSGGGIFVALSGQNSAGSHNNNSDCVNSDDWPMNPNAIPSASPVASAEFQQKQQSPPPPPSQPTAARSPAAAGAAGESRVLRGPSAQQAPTRASAPRVSPAQDPAPQRDDIILTTTNPDAGEDAARGSGRRRLGSVSVVEVDQAANRQQDAVRSGASQETIKGYIYVLMEQHGTTVPVWEDRVHVAEVYRDKPLRTGGLPDPLRPSDVGFLERAEKTLPIHREQLTEARQLLETQLRLPVAARAQPNVVIYDDPHSPLSPANQATAWSDYCQRFHASIDDLLVQTAYLQKRVEALLHPVASPTRQVIRSTPATPRGTASSRASSQPATPRSHASTGRLSRGLRPPPPEKDFTWSMPTRATSRPRSGSATPRGRTASRPGSRASSAPGTPRGRARPDEAAASAASSSSRRHTASEVSPSQLGGQSPPPRTSHRSSVQRGSQPITPGHRASAPNGGTTTSAAVPRQTSTVRRTGSPVGRAGTAADSGSTSTGAASPSVPRLGISSYDRSTPYGQLPGTPRKRAVETGGAGSEQRPSQQSTPPRLQQGPVSPVRSPVSPLGSTSSGEERRALVTQLAALESRGSSGSLARSDLSRARDIFAELYGPEMGQRQYASWLDRLAQSSLGRD